MSVQNETCAPRRAAVYRLFAADGTLLYIGSAFDPEERCKAHRDKPWWPQVARRTEEWHQHRGTAYKEEMAAIATEGSKYNTMGTPTYRTPDTPGTRSRRELAGLRQRLIVESDGIDYATYRAQREMGAPVTEARRAGALAAIEFLDETGLFPGAVKERRRRLASE